MSTTFSLFVENVDPTASDNSYTGNQGATVTGNLIADDTESGADHDQAGGHDPLTVVGHTNPTHVVEIDSKVVSSGPYAKALSALKESLIDQAISNLIERRLENSGYHCPKPPLELSIALNVLLFGSTIWTVTSCYDSTNLPKGKPA